MKIVDYLIILSTWLLSSYTFSSSDVDFKKIKEDNGVFEVQFGVVGQSYTKPVEVETILSSMPFHEVLEVTKRGHDFFINVKTTEMPDFRFYRETFNQFGFEMDVRFFEFHNDQLKQVVDKEIQKIKSIKS